MTEEVSLRPTFPPDTAGPPHAVGKEPKVEFNETEEKLLRVMREHDVDDDVDWMVKAQVGYREFYLACRNKDFIDAVRNVSHDMVMASTKGVVKRAIQAAKKDSYRDRQMILEIGGVYQPRQQTEVSGAIGHYSVADLVRGMRAVDQEEEDKQRVTVEGEYKEIGTGPTMGGASP